MAQNQQIEIAFNVTPVPVNTQVNIEIKPGVGAALTLLKDHTFNDYDNKCVIVKGLFLFFVHY